MVVIGSGAGGMDLHCSHCVWGKLWCSCEIAPRGESSASIFQEVLASIEKNDSFLQGDWALVYNSSKF